MKYTITIFFISFFLSTKGQSPIIKYYDNNWAPAEKEKAVYYATFTKEGDVYKCISYWIDSNIVAGKSTFKDTTMAHRIGRQVLYYKNGDVADSSMYTNDGYTIEKIAYYENRKLALHYSKPVNQEKETIEAYDRDGKRIKDYVYEREAEFPGGLKAWFSYLTKNAGTFYTSEENIVSVKVKIQFVVNANGFTSKITVIESSGIKEVDNDAKRLIAQSPQWNNAIQFNRPVQAYRIMPITYELAPQKKKKG
jgi:Gram-negative bacterial TonB protein C-terminal